MTIRISTAALARRYADDGATLAVLAEEFGASDMTIRRRLRCAGVRLRPPGRKRPVSE